MRGFEHGPQGFDHFEWLGPLLGLLFVAALIVGIILVIRALRSRNPPSAALTEAGAPGVPAPPGHVRAGVQSAIPPSGALTILEERYARGDIGREEFLQRRTDLL